MKVSKKNSINTIGKYYQGDDDVITQYFDFQIKRSEKERDLDGK